MLIWTLWVCSRFTPPVVKTGLTQSAHLLIRNCSALYFRGKWRFIYVFFSNFVVSSRRRSLASATPLRKCSTQTKTFLFLRHNFKSDRGTLWYHVLNSRFHFYWPVPPFCLWLWKSQRPDSLKPQETKNKTAPVLQPYKHSQIHIKFKQQNPKDCSSRQTQPPLSQLR